MLARKPNVSVAIRPAYLMARQIRAMDMKNGISRIARGQSRYEALAAQLAPETNGAREADDVNGQHGAAMGRKPGCSLAGTAYVPLRHLHLYPPQAAPSVGLTCHPCPARRDGNQVHFKASEKGAAALNYTQDRDDRNTHPGRTNGDTRGLPWPRAPLRQKWTGNKNGAKRTNVSRSQRVGGRFAPFYPVGPAA